MKRMLKEKGHWSSPKKGSSKQTNTRLILPIEKRPDTVPAAMSRHSTVDDDQPKQTYIKSM